jgi:hypothetical protein
MYRPGSLGGGFNKIKNTLPRLDFVAVVVEIHAVLALSIPVLRRRPTAVRWVSIALILLVALETSGDHRATAPRDNRGGFPAATGRVAPTSSLRPESRSASWRGPRWSLFRNRLRCRFPESRC